MKNILVPVDFSPSSQSAASAAAFLARQLGSTLHLVHVVDGPPDWNKLSVSAQQQTPLVEARIVEAEIKLQKYAGNKAFDNLSTTTTVLTGIAYDRIVDFARSRKADLVVLGAHGVSEANELFIGSTAQRVIRTAHCPVLSVKKGHKLSSVKRIMFPSDFREDISKAAEAVANLAGQLGAELDYVYVNTPERFSDTAKAEKQMGQYIKKKATSKISTFIYDDYDRESGILNFLKRRQPEIVSLVTHARKGKPSYQMSLTDSLIVHVDQPVLSFVLR